jgi:hypothetical protein
MKKIHLVIIGVLLAGTVLMVGCSRHSPARGSERRGSNTGYYGRNAVLPANGQARDVQNRNSVQFGGPAAAAGSIRELSGVLQYDGSEWFLRNDSGRYLLRFGNAAYLDSTGIDLRDGENIEIRAFIEAEEATVISARIGSQSYTFRSEAGVPLWAGNGRRGGRNGGGQGRNGDGNDLRPRRFQQLPGPNVPQSGS